MTGTFPPHFLAAQKINLGVDLYEHGQLDQAMIAFAEVLAVTKHVGVQWDGGEDDEENDEGDQDGNEKMSDATQEVVLGPFQPEFGKSPCEPTESDLLIFLNPIKIPYDKMPPTKLRKTLSLIAMFNMAIGHHRRAVLASTTTDNDNSVIVELEHLHKALSLYELAYAVQMQECIDMTLTPTMIIMSNVGHIHKILGNLDYSQQCFQHLLSTLMFLVEAGEAHDLNEFEFEGFFDNILKTIYAHSPAAAA